jgi:hypothetical protein
MTVDAFHSPQPEAHNLLANILTLGVSLGGNGAHTVVLAAGQVVTDKDFGNHHEPVTRTWDGGNGVAGNNWTTAANWVDDIAPITGDLLVFAGATQTSTYNDFDPGTAFNSITFTNGNFTLLGNSVTLNPTSGVAVDNVAGQNRIDLPITAGSTGATVVRAGTLRLGLNAQGTVLGGGGADIRGGSLVFDYNVGASPAATIQTLLAASYHGGLWDLGQFRNSTTGSTGLTLGWKDDGVSQVTVRATYAGDFNLDGAVNGLDYDIWEENFGAPGATFPMGDANYNGAVNSMDYDLWEATMGRAPLGGAIGSRSPVPVPAKPSPKAKQTATIPGKSIPLPAKSPAVSVSTPANATGKGPQVAAPTPVTVLSAVCVVAGQGVSPNPNSALVGGINVLPIERNQPSSIPVVQAKPASTSCGTSQSISAAERLSTVLLRPAVLQAAHDAVFSQPEDALASLTGSFGTEWRGLAKR